MTRASALYAGAVTHARARPRAHRLRYRVFMLLIDLDELDDLDGSLGFFSKDRFNLAGFRAADHGDGSATPLKAQVEAHLAAGGIAHGGPIRILCLPRILGRGFNPLSVYFCHDRTGRLSALLYEVSNTFGERHSYLIPVEEKVVQPQCSPSGGAGAKHLRGTETFSHSNVAEVGEGSHNPPQSASPTAPPEGEHRDGVIRQACDKAFYVSPFMDMELSYAFRVIPPREAVSVGVDVHDAAGRVMATAFAGRRRPLSDGALVRAWLGHPWMTVGVLAAIHWEALKIWLKGERLRRRPAAPEHAVTVVRDGRRAAA